MPGSAAKIADVGLARFMHADQVTLVTQMTVMGTMAGPTLEVLR